MVPERKGKMMQQSDHDANEEAVVAAAWGENAALWSKQVRAGRDLYREHFTAPAFARFVGNLTDKTVPNAGCGEGYYARILARDGALVTGVDLSPVMIEQAREQERRAPLGILYKVASFSTLSEFADESFDAVISGMALMDSPEIDDPLAAFARAPRPGGSLIFSVLHPCFATRGVGCVRDEQGNIVAVRVPEYFREEPWVDHWRFRETDPGLPLFIVPRFPRTLSRYLNAVIDAGLVPRELAEPRPDGAACRPFPFLQRWRDHAPLLLFVRATKPGNAP